MRGDDFDFICNVQRLQHLAGVAHCFPIGLGTHDDSNLCVHIRGQLKKQLALKGVRELLRKRQYYS